MRCGVCVERGVGLGREIVRGFEIGRTGRRLLCVKAEDTGGDMLLSRVPQYLLRRCERLSALICVYCMLS